MKRTIAILLLLSGVAQAQEFKVSDRFVITERQQKVETQRQITKPKLYVTSADFYCPPCRKLQADIDAGLFNDFEIVESKPFEGMTGYPSIRYVDLQGNWKSVTGYNDATRQHLIKKLLVKPEVVAVTPSRNYSLFGRVGTSHESRETLIRHLWNDGIHRGRHSISDLNAMSDDQLDRLHSRDHGW